MCLLILMPDDTTVDLDSLKKAARNNPDGFGYAISTRQTILTEKDMDFDRLVNKFLDARAKNKGPALFHLRIATNGTTDLENCHPFYLGADRESVVAHNGILPIGYDPKEHRSDTRIFAESYLPSIGGIAALDDDTYFAQLSTWAKGNKLAFLTVHDDALFDWYIINEKEGDWDKKTGIWYSNDSWKFAYTTQCYGSTAWENDDYAYAYTKPKAWNEYNESGYGTAAFESAMERSELHKLESEYAIRYQVPVGEVKATGVFPLGNGALSGESLRLATYDWEEIMDLRLSLNTLKTPVAVRQLVPGDDAAAWNEYCDKERMRFLDDDEAGMAIYDDDPFADPDLFAPFGLFHFARQVDEQVYITDCYACGVSESVSESELIYRTNCTTCNACLHCAKDTGYSCDCWQEWAEEIW